MIPSLRRLARFQGNKEMNKRKRVALDKRRKKKRRTKARIQAAR